MNFRPSASRDDPEMNFIPLIDVLLVILIFLAASTSFTQMRQLQVALPEASAQALEQQAALSLAISQDGLYALDGQYINGDHENALAQALRQATQGRDPDTLSLRINADALSTHAAVVRALEAARLAGLSRIHFTTLARP
ncbi:MAG TPA: biopolymer transporter ExbD [Castellaniella sp.]|nr:biopolymer transporter ExbD [Castellaniella sp.]